MKQQIRNYVKNKQKVLWEKSINTDFLNIKPILIPYNIRSNDNAENYKRSKSY